MSSPPADGDEGKGTIARISGDHQHQPAQSRFENYDDYRKKMADTGILSAVVLPPV